MSLLTVVQDVCAAVGVERPASVIAGINTNRTMQEMLALANEMAQRIAYDTEEWGTLELAVTYLGSAAFNTDPGYSNFLLPADFQRLLLTTNLRRSSIPTQPLRFISDQDQWLQRRLVGISDPRGEWTKRANQYIAVAPRVIVTDQIILPYLGKNCISLASGGTGDRFQNDGDIFRVDERVLKLGMIWQWKALKGSPYAEDMGNYETALARVAGADRPAPIMIGRQTLSAAMNQSYPFPIDPNMVPL